MPLTINIVGAGAVGSWLAYQLQLSQHKVAFIDPRQAQPVTKVHVEQPPLSQPQSILSFQQVTTDCQLLICSLKAYQVNSALGAVQRPESCPILLLNNGLGVAEHLPLPLQTQLYLGSNTHGCLLLGKQAGLRKVQHSGIGQISIGLWNATTAAKSPSPAWLSTLQQYTPQLKLCWQQDILTSLWLKLAINSCINPLTAIHRCQNGQLLNAAFAPQLQQLCREFTQVAHAEGYDFNPEDLITQVKHVAEITARNYSSMHQDIALHRPSEVDFINAYLLNKAEQHQLHLPLHRQLYQQILQLERRYS